MEALLKVKNLSKSFAVEKDFFGRTKKSLQAVRDISLDIYPGECLTLVGESGCGKSTTARLVLNLITPDKGEVIFAGKNILKLPEKELQANERYS